MKNKKKGFIADENGAETIEWVMIVALLTVIILAVYNTTLNTSLVAAMTKITAHYSGPQNPDSSLRWCLL
jgi:Flp pilus assembly pilin Flp